jgi:hypothetical protein
MRSRVWDDPAGLLVVIPARPRWFAVVFLCVWLLGWAMGELAAVRALFFSGDASGGSTLFLGYWCIGWTVGGALALYSLLWLLVGQERVTLAHDAIVVRKVVFGLGPMKRFDLMRVANLRVATIVEGGTDRTNGLQLPTVGKNGAIAFDDGGRTVRFGLDLEEAEAAWIVAQLSARHAFPAPTAIGP